MIKYYYAGSQRVAMRVCTGVNGSCATSTLTYLHADHLGSASLSTNASGGKVSEMRSPVLQAHYPYGETRSGTMTTDRQFTGQRREIGLGLYDYNARYYDPLPGRFLSADSIVPSPANPQSLNRYAYTLNNPLRYTDPTGHFTRDEIIEYLENHGKSYDEAREIVTIWERSDAHRDWWNVLMKAQVGDRIEGVDARNPNAPFQRTNARVYGYFTQGQNASFDFTVASGKFNNDLANFYSDNPTDRYANKGGGFWKAIWM